ncbi:MAG TPA: hypothetical protein VFI22_10400, partial [Thermomicrobiales bacterium]|nr:hypothetical protein [Thermomicrobiales bacterium]
MAEWIGRRRSGPGEASPQTVPEKIELSPDPLAPPAPGAFASPQMPGEVPDRSSVPGHHSLVVPPATRPVRRPISEYGTAQRIMRMYQAAPGEEMNPKRFESVPASDEEIRKANPDLGRPVRPLPGYVLGRGAGAASLEAFEASEAAEAAELPARTGPPASGQATASLATPGQSVASGQPAPAPAPGATTMPAAETGGAIASAASSAPQGLAARETIAAGAAAPPVAAAAGTSPAQSPEAEPAATAPAGEREADRAARSEPAARRGGQAKTAELSAAAARHGALRGSGSHDCPASHPVKGNAQSG